MKSIGVNELSSSSLTYERTRIKDLLNHGEIENRRGVEYVTGIDSGRVYTAKYLQGLLVAIDAEMSRRSTVKDDENG